MSSYWPNCFLSTVAPDVPIWFPARYAEANLAYSLDVSPALAPGDVIGSASVSVAPSGAGEMVPTGITINGTVVTILPSGGQPGRVYRYNLTVAMTDGNVYPFLIQQGVLKLLATDVPQVPPSPGFGTVITCNFPSPIVSSGPAYITALGNSQASSAILVAQISIINAGMAGSGVRLPPSAASDTTGAVLTIINENPALEYLYPDGSDSIGNGAPGAPAQLQASTGYMTVNIVPGSTNWVIS